LTHLLVKRMGEKLCLARRAERCLASQVSDAQQRQARFLAHSLRVLPRRPPPYRTLDYRVCKILRLVMGTSPDCTALAGRMCAGRRTSLRRQAACRLQPCSTTLPARDMAGTLCLKDMSTRPSKLCLLACNQMHARTPVLPARRDLSDYSFLSATRARSHSITTATRKNPIVTSNSLSMTSTSNCLLR